MADKQAAPRIQKVRHPIKVVSGIQMSPFDSGRYPSPVFRAASAPLRVIWHAERGPAQAVTT
tara:strand:+ start:427 stop:612 length:186 start_codon:yes stop_codon:yes gene_type:complete